MSSQPGDSELADDTDAVVQPTSQAAMLAELEEATGHDFEAAKNPFLTFMTGAESGVQESDIFGALLDIHTSLSDERVLGKIRGVEAWADGEQNFRLVPKSWSSVIDKLYRINIEENKQYGSPPFVHTIYERVAKTANPSLQRWITPNIAHEVADDLIRTKFVVPFADGVVNVSDRVTDATNQCGLPRFRRYHAKDSGYHARHHYILVPVPGYDGTDTSVAVEVKILTKLQDTLGELTHLLYELQRTGSINSEPKRKLAWLFDSPDFASAYIGHTAHFVEASIVELKKKIQGFEDAEYG